MSETTAVIENSAVEVIERQTSLVVQQAGDLVVSDDESLEEAGLFLRGIKTVLAKINDTFDSAIRSAHTTHKTMLAAKKEHASPLLKAEIVVKQAIGTYTAEQERLRRIEAERIEREAREAEERRQREVKAEEECRLAEAEALEAAGKAEEAAAVLDAPEPEPETVAVQPKPKPAAKAAGVTTRTVWKWRLRSLDELPRAYMMVDEKAITAVVNSLKGDTGISGVYVYSEQQVAAKAL